MRPGAKWAFSEQDCFEVGKTVFSRNTNTANKGATYFINSTFQDLEVPLWGIYRHADFQMFFEGKQWKRTKRREYHTFHTGRAGDIMVSDAKLKAQIFVFQRKNLHNVNRVRIKHAAIIYISSSGLHCPWYTMWVKQTRRRRGCAEATRLVFTLGLNYQRTTCCVTQVEGKAEVYRIQEKAEGW